MCRFPGRRRLILFSFPLLPLSPFPVLFHFFISIFSLQGLPDERKHALKVFHHYADHPKVGTVILSNTTLDAAKTNRCAQVLLPHVGFDDLVALAKGLLVDKEGRPISNEQTLDRLSRGVCEAFTKIRETRKWRVFDLRDLVYLLRDIRQQILSAQPLGGPIIYHALARNFNGVTTDEFQNIVSLFFEEINQSFQKSELVRLQVPIQQPTLVEIVRESIEQTLMVQEEDPSQAPHRYLMLIDPTGVESSLNALRILKIPAKKPLKMISVSDFPEDDSEIARGRQITEVKNSMELGETIILINSGPIQTNFYELFNKYFVSAIGNDQTRQYYANLAIGSHSRPCRVHPDFQVIISISQEEFNNAPAPFCSRFEKYLFSLKEVYEVEGKRFGKEKIEPLFEGIKDFVRFSQPNTFYGLVEDETLYSLMLNILKDSDSKHVNRPVIPKPFILKEEPDAPFEMDDEIQEHALLRSSIQNANFFLMQIAKPESILLLRRGLRQSYLTEYFLKQEHFSVLNFFDHLLPRAFNENKPVSRKWIIYTRSSGELFRLSTDIKLRSLLISSLFPEEKREKVSAEEITSWLSVIPLATIGSAKACEEEIDGFFSSEKKILVCSSDMTKVTKRQLSHFIKLINEKPEEFQASKLVVILVHFSANESQITDYYSTVFTNGWNYSFIDSFGAHYSLPPEDKQNAISLKKTPDIRKWIRVAFFGDELDAKENELELLVHLPLSNSPSAPLLSPLL